jgi:hypothetical protein
VDTVSPRDWWDWWAQTSKAPAAGYVPSYLCGVAGHAAVVVWRACVSGVCRTNAGFSHQASIDYACKVLGK